MVGLNKKEMSTRESPYTGTSWFFKSCLYTGMNGTTSPLICGDVYRRWELYVGEAVRKTSDAVKSIFFYADVDCIGLHLLQQQVHLPLLYLCRSFP